VEDKYPSGRGGGFPSVFLRERTTLPFLRVLPFARPPRGPHAFSLMYSQIFVLTRRYHSPSSPGRLVAIVWCSCVCAHARIRQRVCEYARPARRVPLFPPSVEGWNSFRGPTPSTLTNGTTAVRLLRLSLPYSSKLIPSAVPRPLPAGSLLLSLDLDSPFRDIEKHPYTSRRRFLQYEFVVKSKSIVTYSKISDEYHVHWRSSILEIHEKRE